MASVGWVRPDPDTEKKEKLQKCHPQREVGVDNNACLDTVVGIGTSVQQALETEIGSGKKVGEFVFSKEVGSSSEPSLGNDDLSAEKSISPLDNQPSSSIHPTELLTKKVTERLQVNISTQFQPKVPDIIPINPPVTENQPNPTKTTISIEKSQLPLNHLASPTTSTCPDLPKNIIPVHFTKPVSISNCSKTKTRKPKPISLNKSPSPSTPYFVELPDDSPPSTIDPIPPSYENVLSKGIQQMLNLKRGRDEDESHLGTKRRLLQLTDSDFQILQLDQYGSNELQFFPMAEEAGLIKPPTQL
ncbi:hypothetical protein RJT34_17342 [Clitoria ternatea]|uniref:Uncharacterized protein n=1 Tax=Clitoria ternatea TaxID=43366 RepID=A0AAN9PD58_CLITE